MHANGFCPHFATAGLDVSIEDSTSHGRLDMAVRFHGNGNVHDAHGFGHDMD